MIKQLAIISGKGGTGKTFITTGFSYIAKDFVLCDCDVDSFNLNLVLKYDIKKTIGFHGLKIADINKKICNSCKECIDFCRFNAIDDKINIIKESCVGCGVCQHVCPSNAIKLIDHGSSLIHVSDSMYGSLVYAKLESFEESYGHLIKMLLKNSQKIAEEKNKEIIIIDGSSGTSFSVICTITDADFVLIVTEPTVSGFLGFKRIVKLCENYNKKCIACINKSDINSDITEQIKRYCIDKNLEIVGKIPYNEKAMNEFVKGNNFLDRSEDSFKNDFIKMWNRINEIINKKE